MWGHVGAGEAVRRPAGSGPPHAQSLGGDASHFPALSQTDVPGPHREAEQSVVLMEKSGGTVLQHFAIFSRKRHCWNGLPCKPSHLPEWPSGWQGSTLVGFENQCLITLIHPLAGQGTGQGTPVQSLPSLGKTGRPLSSRVAGNLPNRPPLKHFHGVPLM